MASAIPFVEAKLKQKKIIVFSKSYSPEGGIIKSVLGGCSGLTEDRYEWVNIEKRSDCPQIEDFLWLLSGKNTREVPLLFVKRRCVGGYQEILQLNEKGLLQRLLDKLCLNVDDEDEDLTEEERERQNEQLLVRVTRLDDTEVVVKVADWIHLGPIDIVDFDAFRDSDSATCLTAGMRVTKKTSDGEFVRRLSQEEDDPEWMYLGGSQRHKISSIAVQTAEATPSRLLLKKSSHRNSNKTQDDRSQLESKIDVNPNG